MLSQSLFLQRQGIYRRAECHHWNLWRATKGRWYQCIELRYQNAEVVSQIALTGVHCKGTAVWDRSSTNGNATLVEPDDLKQALHEHFCRVK